MLVNRVLSGEASQAAAGMRGDASVRNRGEMESRPDDRVQLGSTLSPDEVDTLTRMGRARAGSPKASSTISVLELIEPGPGVPPARNNTPVIVVHGTMADAKSINPYLEPDLEAGHPVSLDTYSTIKEGEPLQVSGQLVSRDINAGRVEVARKQVALLKSRGGDLEAVKSFLCMDGGLYGAPDPAFDRVAALVPGVVDQLDTLLQSSQEELLQGFSSRTRQMEQDLAAKVAETGFGAHIGNEEKRGEVCEKVAAEIMDSIAPKAVLVGHSMGGFVSYVLTVNPAQGKDRASAFAYDGGNGVSTVITLSSPVKSGVSRPLPPAMTHYAFDTYEKTVLAPMEATPGMQFAMLNPAFAAWYTMQKESARQASAAMSNASAEAMNPWSTCANPAWSRSPRAPSSSTPTWKARTSRAE